jgi:outer membrane protein insertion porin family
MLSCRQVNFFISSLPIIAALAFILIVSSCTIPKKYQKGKPFVYKSDITLKNVDLPPSDRLQLKEGLQNQVDDSLQVKTVVAVRVVPPFFYNRLNKPAVFDTMYIGRSKTFMTALLNSQGYFNPSITDTFWIDTISRLNQMRAHVKFFVEPRKALRYDSIGYEIRTPELQELALANRDKSLLKKKNPYSIQTISNELDRLLNIYRDHGYYKITKEDLYVELDTVVAALIDPSLDPFEQFQLLDSLSKKTREPTINVVVKQRLPKDSTHLDTYTWGKINVYSDRQILQEGAKPLQDSVKINGYTVFQSSKRFKLPFIARNISIKPGSLYRQADYFKTINTFTNLGAWEQVDITVNERTDSSKIIDADILLYPAKKQSLNIDFETSRNASDVLTTGNLFGIGLNLGIRNRNGFRESISSSSNVRFGVELGPDIIQTVQASFSHNIYVPRFITPFKINSDKLINPRTIINFSTAYTNRRQFFDVRSVNTSWGYDWTKNNKNWQYIPFNIEYTNVHKEDSLLNLEKKFQSLARAFNDGFIISQILAFTTGNKHAKSINFFRTRLEESGAIFGLIKKLDEGRLRRFLKLDLEYKFFINNTKSTWAFRAYGGYGLVYGRQGDTAYETNLPFFKAYFGGGPYSMRAWPVRRLGLGSTSIFEGEKTERFGDMQLEGNVEYRFSLGTVAGIKIKSALFTDIGNIWAKTVQNGERVDSTEFNLKRLYTDLAVGAGTSLRFDFDFFLIRLDWGYQLKNPAFAKENEGWFHSLHLKDGQFQLGIGYPF